MTLAFGLLAGAATALAVHFVGRLFYLILLFPLVWGVGIGAAVAAGVRVGKCRNAAVGLGAGIVAAVASFGLFQALENMHVRSTFKEYWAKTVKVDVNDAKFNSDADRAWDDAVREKHGGAGFLSQMAVRAEMGMNISRRGRGGDGKPMISGTGMYVYWFIEMAIVAGICGLIGLGATRDPFCEPCAEWYDKKELAGIVPGKVDDVRKAVVSKDFAALPSLVVRTNPGGAISLEKCPKCSTSPAVVKVERVTVDDKGKEQRATVYEDLVAAADAQAIEQAVTPAGGAT
jgi:hypothetical protein